MIIRVESYEMHIGVYIFTHSTHELWFPIENIEKITLSRRLLAH